MYKNTSLQFLSLIFALQSQQLLAADPASYQQALEQYYAQSQKSNKGPKFSEQEKEVMQQAAAKLARERPNPGLEIGTKAPDFTLPNAYGKPVKLSDQLENGPVVLVFYRGAWCPFCNMHLHALNRSLPEFKKHGAQLIAITPQQPDKSRQQLKKDGYPFEVLSDLDDSVMKAYRLFYNLDPALDEVYKNHGLNVAQFNGPGRTVLPIPGTLVIDKDGKIRAVHAETDYKKRMEPADIIEALKKL